MAIPELEYIILPKLMAAAAGYDADMEAAKEAKMAAKGQIAEPAGRRKSAASIRISRSSRRKDRPLGVFAREQIAS